MKRLVILGAAESGIGAAMLAKKQGYEVFVSDFGKIKQEYKKQLQKLKIDFEEAKHSLEKILNADEIVKSPGIAEKTEVMKKVRAKKIPVISEIEFAFRFTKGKIIGITGSNGKSTTTKLTYHMLKKAGFDVACVGNIGDSFAKQVAERDCKYYVAEISNFQLDDIKTFRPHIAILLNITPDHLDRYEYKLENYVTSKFRIAENQTAEDFFIYCLDDEILNENISKFQIKAKKIPYSIQQKIDEGGFLENENLIIHLNQKPLTMSIYELALQGKHNLYNSMAAAMVGKIFDLKKEIIRESLSDFQALEHRMEFVSKVHGIEFINDSKATNVNSVWYALEMQQNPVILILGGVDKGNDYSILHDLVKQKVKAIVCLGKDNRRIHEAFSKIVDIIVNTTSADECVKVAYHLGKNGDTVLLSPACASFDLFQNYEDRGRQFKKAVRAL